MATAEDRVEQARTYAERGFDVVMVSALADSMANVAFVAGALDAFGLEGPLAFDAV